MPSSSEVASRPPFLLLQRLPQWAGHVALLRRMGATPPAWHGGSLGLQGAKCIPGEDQIQGDGQMGPLGLPVSRRAQPEGLDQPPTALHHPEQDPPSLRPSPSPGAPCVSRGRCG